MSAPQVLTSTRLTPRLTEHTLQSPTLGATTGVRVLVPPSEAGPGPFPVLWLLHGGDDDFRCWSTTGDVERLTEDLALVVVMPDCGRGGWYSDWVRPETDGARQLWTSFHLGELRGWVESTLPVRTDRRGRTIAGLSMGGFGAMSYAARHPELFCFAAAFSGALDILDPILGPFADAMSEWNGGTAGSIWGDPVSDVERWRAHNPVDLAERLADVELQLRTGNGRPGGRHGGDVEDLIETTVHRATVTMHQRLIELGKDHVFEDWGPGAHAWGYWSDALASTLPALMAATQAVEVEAEVAGPGPG
jgi:S-formylglutathione hydrolase FrmB